MIPRLSEWSVRPKCLVQCLCLAILFVATGCQNDISNEYGRRVGKTGAASVNGTNVLTRMFREAGARVGTATRLGRVIEKSDVVVWIPDRYAPPSKDSREFFEDWLADGYGRTLIYVGRDFDATGAYWKHLADNTPKDEPEQFLEARKKLAESIVAEKTQRAVYDPNEDCDWFAIDRTQPSRKVKSLSGRLNRGVSAKNVDMELHARFEESKSVSPKNTSFRSGAELERILESDDDMLVGKFTRKNWSNSQILIVTNGSWLLNLPLVNHEHRKLAGNLINECGNANRVVFLESGPDEPAKAIEGSSRHPLLAAFTEWPINCILMHLLVLGIVYCFAAFPIFGRPRRLRESGTADFGKHIGAIGELLSRTQDRPYAMACRQQYFERVADKSDAKNAGVVMSSVPDAPVTTTAVNAPTMSSPAMPSASTTNNPIKSIQPAAGSVPTATPAPPPNENASE